MDYEHSKVDKALNFIGMYTSFQEIKTTLNLNDKEVDELKTRAKQRYGKEVFSN